MPTDAVLITVATSMEIAPFLEQIKGVHGHTLLPGVKVFTGCLYKRKLQVLITGPGMVNTAMALGAFLLQHRPGLIIQTGIAGFFPDQGLGPGDLAIATAQMDIHSRVESANTVDTVGTVHHPLPFALCTAPMVGSDGQLAMHPGLVSATQTLLSRAMAPGAAPVVTGPFITVSTLTTAPVHHCPPCPHLLSDHGGHGGGCSGPGSGPVSHSLSGDPQRFQPGGPPGQITMVHSPGHPADGCGPSCFAGKRRFTMGHHLATRERLNIAHYFLFLMLFASLFLSYQMIRAFLDPIIIAVILAVLSNPVYIWLKARCNNHQKTAALLVCLLLLLLIIIPLSLVFLAVIKQGIVSFNAITDWVAQGNIEKLTQAPLVAQVSALFRKYMNTSLLKGVDLNGIMLTVSSHAGEILVNQGKYLIGNIAAVTGKFCLMTFVFFFVIQEQEKNFQYIAHLIPLSSVHEKIVVDKIKAVARSALLGTLVTAVAQGIAGGIAFTICGLPGVFWGAVMVFASLIPLVGTALIWAPAAIWLFISGHWKLGIFMGVWSVVVVGMIDNLLRPLFMKGGAGMGTLLIFFAILGGINYFGLIGLLYGPMIFGLALVLLYIYDLEFQHFLDHQDRN